MEKITTVFGTNQRTKRIITQLTQVLLYKPDMSNLKISNEDYEVLVKTFNIHDQERMRNGGMKILGVPICSVKS